LLTDLLTSCGESALPPPFANPPETGTMTASSSSVFHSPHCEQRPAQLLCTAPQLLQTNLTDGFFAMFI